MGVLFVVGIMLLVVGIAGIGAAINTIFSVEILLIGVLLVGLSSARYLYRRSSRMP